jgi:hypothetical protein
VIPFFLFRIDLYSIYFLSTLGLDWWVGCVLMIMIMFMMMINTCHCRWGVSLFCCFGFQVQAPMYFMLKGDSYSPSLV